MHTVEEVINSCKTNITVESESTEAIRAGVFWIKLGYSKDGKHVLLQAVRQHYTHRAPQGKKNEFCTKVRRTVISSIPHFTWAFSQKLSAKQFK